MLDSDKTEDFKYTNKLIHETSPYLLQHAHNPVNWYPWGEDALNLASEQDKPIFLSIGYAACHWCHVMEKESFENEDIAHILNEHFISIKVDREERPDIDDIYMSAVQLMTQHGGWPLSVWLTPDLKPFFGGTYFPPEDRWGRMGFGNVLNRVRELWDDKRDEIINSAAEITTHLHSINEVKSSQFDISRKIWEQAFIGAESNFDSQYGGFGNAPKFPQPTELSFLMRYSFHTKNKNALKMAEDTLCAMMHGGIHDQLGGGFHRYSTDRRWLVPHFEKMLYDNALLAIAFLEACQITGEPQYTGAASGILDYVLREMAAPEGGYYSSQDADSEGIEGRYFVWTKQEIDSLLDENLTSLFCDIYSVSEEGNWEGVNILYKRRSLDVAAHEHNILPEELHAQLDQAKDILFKERQRRVPPATDDKILTAWNSLMISAMCKGYQVLGDEKYLASAEKSMKFILHNLLEKDRLRRSYRAGRARFDGYLSDYAFLTAALLDLYETTFEWDYLFQAFYVHEKMMANFWDEEEQEFYFTAHNHEKLLLRTRKFNDGAIPAGNSVAIENLLRFSELTGHEEYRNMAANAIKPAAEQLSRFPFACSALISSFDFLWGKNLQIVIAGEKNAEQTQQMQKHVLQKFLPNKILLYADSKEIQDVHISQSLIEGKQAQNGQSLIYVCENYTCQQPFSTIEEFEKYYNEQLAMNNTQ